jgi:hypothetical protein
MHIRMIAYVGAAAITLLSLNACGANSSTLPNATNPTSGGTLHPMSASGSTIQRPISDFLNAQGTLSPAPDNFTGWTAFRKPMPNCPTGTSSDGFPFGEVDFAGLNNAWIVLNGGTSLGTTESGYVHQTDNGDGTSTVSVQLDTTNAQSVVFCDEDGNLAGPYFGYTAHEILAGGVTPALANSHLSAVFTIVGTGPAAPLPDFDSMLSSICPAPAPCFKTLKFTATGTGALRSIFGVPEGTPGTMSIEQTATFHFVGRAGRIDGASAEFVTVQPAN